MEIIVGIDTPFNDQIVERLRVCKEQKKLQNTKCYSGKMNKPNSIEWVKKDDLQGTCDLFVLLYRQLAEVDDMLSCFTRSSLDRAAKKTFLVIDMIGSDRKQKSALQQRLAYMLLDSRRQVLTVNGAEELQDLVVDLSRALEKRPSADPFVNACKAVRVTGEERCGLRKLWQSQLQVLWNYSQRRKNQSFLQVDSATILRRKFLREGVDEELVVFGEEAANARPNAKFLEAVKAQLSVTK